MKSLTVLGNANMEFVADDLYGARRTGGEPPSPHGANLDDWCNTLGLDARGVLVSRSNPVVAVGVFVHLKPPAVICPRSRHRCLLSPTCL